MAANQISTLTWPMSLYPETLIIIDSLNPPASSEPRALPAFLSSIVTPHASVVAVYHADVAPVLPPSSRPYEPHPLSILLHLATAVLRVTSLSQAVARRRAQDKSLPEPEWGLREGREGVLIGLRESGRDTAGDGIVVEMEARRRSGRAVAEKFVLARDRADGAASAITLLAHHALFARPDDGDEADGEAAGRRDRMDTTFDLGLTEKQRRDREAIVLPYFDAKTDIGAGEGGRILYDMGREDDFDDEEDEV